MLRSKWLIAMAIALLLGSLVFSIAVIPAEAYAASSPVPRSMASAQPINALAAHTTFHIHRAATQAPTGLSPTQIRAAYNLSPTGGTGTIAIVDAYDDPTVLSDLNVFSSQFGLPPANFEKHMMASSISTNGGWALEISLDVQWAHAIAPYAKILLVEARSNSLTDLLAAVNYARNRADVVAISMSWGASEFSSESYYDSYFTSSYGATFFASSGDNGKGVIWPSASPNVVAVGGTTLTFSGGLVSETAWSGSGGGISKYEAEPSYQTTYGISGTNGKRAVPDVSYDADPYSGVSVYDSTPYSGATGWWQVGGTSAGAPQWAAIQSLGRSASNNNFYQDAESAYSSYFRDITSGSNGYPATAGYDLVTGLGSPLTTDYAPVTTPDFSISASPNTQTVAQGGSANYTITITPSNGFNSVVSLSVNGLPTGANGAFTPNPTISSSSLSVTTSSSTPAGTYTLTISGASGSLTRTTTVTLVVNPPIPPGFTLSASPASRTVKRGSSTTYAITITPAGGFTGSVTLSVSRLPSRTTGTFSPNPTTSSSTLTITTSSGTARGTYKLTITGSSNGLTSTTTVTLVVTR
jgi:subtilase family serine protease